MKRCKKLKSELPSMKRCTKLKSELPDSIISYIFSKLALKDLVKTSALSKRWVHEWGLRADLNFDLHTMFDYNTIQDLPNILPLFQIFHFQSEFTTRLDQFMLHYKGPIISSIRVNFPLVNSAHGDAINVAINRLISKGIAKGVKRIELLLSSDFVLPYIFPPYIFPPTLLSGNDSLTYLHLQNCLSAEHLDYSGFNNLRTPVLHLINVTPKLLQSLCSNCTRLVDLTLDVAMKRRKKLKSELPAMKRCTKLESELPAMKRCTKLESELPDSVISYIFSKLALKDLVKTSALSKRWVHEWGLRTDLNFDLHTMFDSNTIQVPNTFPLYQRLHFQSEFATRLDQFMLHYKGAIIHSIRVKFPLVNPLHGDAISNAINRLISKGIAKGVKRIELLLSSDSVTSYILPPTLLSGNHSLTYLHVQSCLIGEPLDYCTGFNNLTTLVLDLISVTPKLVQSLCSICTHLVDLTLDDCQFPSDLIINCSTLLRLNIVNCMVYLRSCLTIIASNLSSFEYSCNDDYQVHPINIQAHMLSKFSFRGVEFFQPVGFSGLKNVTTIVLDGEIENLSMDILPYLFSECLQLEDVTFKNFRHMSSIEIITSPKLRHLKIIDCGWADYSPSEIAIDAFNLSSFEYSAHIPRIISITAPKLLKVFWNASPGRKTPHLLDPIARLSHIENLSMIILTSQIEELTKVLVRFQNLRQLELLIEGGYDPSRDYFWILDIAMASQHLQKLSLTIRNLHREHSHIVEFKRQKREYTGFSHNDLKHVEFHGCVGSINVIELANDLLRSATSLNKMIFSSRDKAYIGAGRWTRDANDRRRRTIFCGVGGCRWFGENVIHEMLKDEVNEQCQLIIL